MPEASKVPQHALSGLAGVLAGSLAGGAMNAEAWKAVAETAGSLGPYGAAGIAIALLYFHLQRREAKCDAERDAHLAWVERSEKATREAMLASAVAYERMSEAIEKVLDQKP